MVFDAEPSTGIHSMERCIIEQVTFYHIWFCLIFCTQNLISLSLFKHGFKGWLTGYLSMHMAGGASERH